MLQPEAALEHMEKVLSLQVLAQIVPLHVNMNLHTLGVIPAYDLQPGHPEVKQEIDSIRTLVIQREQDPSNAGQWLNVV